ncbi:MAG: hypothetical protein GY820_00020 [Gammaproteobacteria bacterium]|nr:hypothetical protein [Gammaproteobacteria bacterium]
MRHIDLLYAYHREYIIITEKGYKLGAFQFLVQWRGAANLAPLWRRRHRPVRAVIIGQSQGNFIRTYSTLSVLHNCRCIRQMSGRLDNRSSNRTPPTAGETMPS